MKSARLSTIGCVASIFIALSLSACGDSDEQRNDVGISQDATSDTQSGDDPYAEARATCVSVINQFRADNGKGPLDRWTDAESCSDVQSNADQSSGTAHGSFGDCDERGQNQCLGQGADGVERCLQSMWDERLLGGCSGCDACAESYNPDCAGCDFYGTDTGDVCGHYANMNAEYFSEVACGFSDEGGWVTINFR